jgi:hypothetical protein
VNDPIAGCCRDAADCEAICTVDRTCDAGTCTGGSPRPCDDGDPCTVDTCEVSTGCVSPERPGFAALACVCERAAPAACAGETPLKSLAKRARRACRIIARADGAPARKRTKLLGRVGALFGRAAKIATKNAGQRGMSEACGAALAERFTDDQSRALAVREQP